MANPTAPLGSDKATGTGTSQAITPQSSNGKALVFISGSKSAEDAPEAPATLTITGGAGGTAYLLREVRVVANPELLTSTGVGGSFLAVYWTDDCVTASTAYTFTGLNAGGIASTTRSVAIYMIYGAPAGRPDRVEAYKDDALRYASAVNGSTFTGPSIELVEANDLLIFALATENTQTTPSATPNIGAVADVVNSGAPVNQLITATYTAAGAVSSQATSWTLGGIGAASPNLGLSIAVLFRGDTYSAINKITVDPTAKPFYRTGQTVRLAGTYDVAAGTVFTTMDYQLTNPFTGAVITAWTNVTPDNIDGATKTWRYDFTPTRGSYNVQVRMKNAGGTVVATSTIPWRPFGVGPVLAVFGSSSAQRMLVTSGGAPKLRVERHRSWRWDPEYTQGGVSGVDKFNEHMGNGGRGFVYEALRQLDDFYGDGLTPICLADCGISGTGYGGWDQVGDTGIINVNAAETTFGGFDGLFVVGTGTNDMRAATNNAGFASKSAMRTTMDGVVTFWRTQWPGVKIYWAECNRAPLEEGLTATGAASSDLNWTWYNENLRDIEAGDADFHVVSTARWAGTDADNIHMSYAEYAQFGRICGHNWAKIYTGQTSEERPGPAVVGFAREAGGTLLAQFDADLTTRARTLTGVTGFVVGSDPDPNAGSLSAHTAEIVGDKYVRLTPSTSFPAPCYPGYAIGSGTQPVMTNPLCSVDDDVGFSDKVIAYGAAFYEGTSTAGVVLDLAAATLVGGETIQGGDHLTVCFQQDADANPSNPTGWGSNNDALGFIVLSQSPGARTSGTRGCRIWSKRLKASEVATSFTIPGITATNTRAKMVLYAITRGPVAAGSAPVFGINGTGSSLSSGSGWTKSSTSTSFLGFCWGHPDLATITPPTGYDTIMAPTLVGTTNRWLAGIYIKRDTLDYTNGSAVSFTGLGGANIKVGFIMDLRRA